MPEQDKPQTQAPPMSAAMRRLYEYWPEPDERNNEFFSNFKYTHLTGLGKSPDASRRDPSKVLKVDGLYYVWYTRRAPSVAPVGMDQCSASLPAVDWDLADIYYATSEDGFDWREQGLAIGRAAAGHYGDRAVTTADVLHFGERYYLYYQSFSGEFSNSRGDHCDVSMAWADCVEGPWHKMNEPVLPLGAEEHWDGGAIHDPYPLVYQGKIWLFYKGQPLPGKADRLVRAQGVAIADSPAGPFIKHSLNPLLNSGHETCLFPYKQGIAALLSVDGPEKNTVQFAADGLNFDVMASVSCPPIAPGPYCPDAFADNGDGQGITWGLCHINTATIVPNNPRRIVESESFLARFDCDLHRQTDRPYFKNPRDQVGRFNEATYFQGKMQLEENARQDVIDENKKLEERQTLSIPLPR